MRAARFTEPCISTEGCISSNAGTFTFEGELDPGSNIDFDEVYENDDRERFEDTIPCPESARPARHLLQAYSRDAAYGLRENRLANKKLRNARGYRSALRRRLDDDDDYQDEDDAEEGDSEEDAPGYDDKVDEEEDDEEEGGEETVTDEEQERYYDYDAGESVSIRGRAPLVAELVALNVLLQLLGC
ncbi:uncharacterized protein LOC143372054 [Andrena cerasifolii]|uniref:uncharacterized protein LOC143372054 n=1 Tax=Andrena cerasifolii TaxID=2819439 RepID=UPI004037F931